VNASSWAFPCNLAPVFSKSGKGNIHFAHAPQLSDVST
jgi:hypothetical protein